MAEVVSAQSLADTFDRCFSDTLDTRLVIGAQEPYYVPRDTAAEFTDGVAIRETPYARIFSRADFPASVMHEVAHWCIAGARRRELLDYGYWYEPDGRSADQQVLFESVEVKPQALERIMSRAAGMLFRLSADNANDPMARPSDEFKNKVHQQTLSFLKDGLPQRAGIYCKALSARYSQGTDYLKISSYLHQDLL